MVEGLRKLVASGGFNWTITGVIVAAGGVVGLETSPGIVARHGATLHTLDVLILGIFVTEILLKMGAEGRRPWRFFLDGWNVFDFLIVAACFMPVDAQYVTILRLARLLRVLRLVRALPQLQVLVGALIKSIPSIAYVSTLLGLLFYIYGVAAVFLFRGNDPVHFGNLSLSLLSLFRVVTLEDWTDIMYIQMYGCEGYGYGGMEALCTESVGRPVGAALFFVSFVLLGTMIVLNLFIGVIMNGMDEARREQREPDLAQEGDSDLVLGQLTSDLDRLQLQVGRLRASVPRNASSRSRRV